MISRGDQFWADYLGVAPSDWSVGGVSIRAHVGLAGYRGLWCFRRQDRTVVAAPPGWVDHLTLKLGGCPPDHLLDEGFLTRVLGADTERVIGPALHGCLDPDRFQPALASNVRRVEASDQAAVERFRVECGAGDWEIGGLDGANDHRAACFLGPRMVALAGFRSWSDVAGDPCVVTHPEFRGAGYGAAVVSLVVSQALAEGRLLLYQTLEANRGAVQLALKLGYQRYARHLAVRLKGDAPSPRASGET